MADLETPSVESIRSNVDAASDAIKVTREQEKQQVGALRSVLAIMLLGWTQRVLSSRASTTPPPDDPVKATGDLPAKPKSEDKPANLPAGSNGATTPPKEQASASSRSHDALERNAGWLTLLTGILLVIALIFWKDDAERFWYCAVALCAFLLSGIVLFTRPLLTEADLNAIFRFSWSFVAVIAVFGVLFLALGFAGRSGLAVPAPPPEPSSTTDQDFAAVRHALWMSDRNPSNGGLIPPAASVSGVRSLPTPSAVQGGMRRPYMLAIVPGCDYDAIPTRNGESTAGDAQNERKNHAGMPENIFCGDLPPQWVLVIGGNIVDCHFDGSCPRVLDRPNLSKLQLEHRIAASNLADAKRRAAAATQRIEDIEILRINGIDARVSAAQIAALELATKNVADWTPKADKAKAELDAASAFKDFHRHIEGNPIVGGVVVPVFFIAIAMIGALINMGRKLTEFQERATDEYRKNYESKAAASDGTNPPLSREAARDLLVFQTIQVLTTPGIAVLAYSWARPEEQATTVILAFAAGFSSEVFLMTVRSIVDRVVGLGPRPTRVRMLVAADATGNDGKGTLPSRGEDSTKRTSGGFKVGDAVRLEKPVGPCLPGAEGVVLSIEPDGELIVRTTRDHTGAALSFRLQSQPPESFSHIGAAPKTEAGPAG